MSGPVKNNNVRAGLLYLIAILVLVELVALIYFSNLLRGAGTSSPTSDPLAGSASINTTEPGGTPPAPPDTGSGSLTGETTEDSATATALANLPTPDPWDGKGRVTILVMGLDYADWESEDRVGPPRSDTMILFTIDPTTKTAGILSIPRDLWVTMPGIEGEHKINTAHRFGELYEMPGGGPGLAMRTIERLLEVPINFYAVIDFYAFEKFIDEIGGIEVDVPAEIKVDPIGPDNTVVLKPGLQVLDGPTALAYARNRSTVGDEDDRASRQQQVIMGIREKVFRLNNLPLLILKAPALYSSLDEGIRTNMSLEQAIRLAWLAREISPENIQRATIGSYEVIYDTAEDGQAIFVPIIDRILALRDKIFASSTSESSQGLTKDELIAAENSRITIINQTGDKSLGELTAEYMRENGLNVIQVEQSEETRSLTRLVDRVGDPNTFRFVIDLLSISPSETYINIDMASETDLEVYLGLDWAEENPIK